MKPRIRTIKPELWESEDFMGLSLIGKVAFFCLISHADDEGRLKTKASHLAAAWLHADEGEVEGGLVALEAADMIQRYEADGKQLIQLTNWSEHQRVDRPTASRYPAPPAKSRDGSRNGASALESSSLARARVSDPDRTGPDRTGPEGFPSLRSGKRAERAS